MESHHPCGMRENATSRSFRRYRHMYVPEMCAHSLYSICTFLRCHFGIPVRWLTHQVVHAGCRQGGGGLAQHSTGRRTQGV